MDAQNRAWNKALATSVATALAKGCGASFLNAKIADASSDGNGEPFTMKEVLTGMNMAFSKDFSFRCINSILGFGSTYGLSYSLAEDKDEVVLFRHLADRLLPVSAGSHGETRKLDANQPARIELVLEVMGEEARNKAMQDVRVSMTPAKPASDASARPD